MQFPDVHLLNEASGDPFPCIRDIYCLYQHKGIRTVFFSLGNSPSCMVDLEIAETIGCPIHIIANTEDSSKAWAEVKDCLKTHKVPVEPFSAFSAGAETKWILPKNIRLYSESEHGPIRQMVKTACELMRISEGDTRIDILKVDLENGGERKVIYDVIDAGFRPATVLVRWSESPDASYSTKNVAGHLQNCGYVPIGKVNNTYLYYFVDNDMYATCSWEQIGAVNPMVDAVVNEALAQVRAQAEAVPPPTGTTDTEHVLAAIKTLVSDLGILIKSSPPPLASTLAIAKALGLPLPTNSGYTQPLFYTWISKLFDKLDAMNLSDDERATRKEIIGALKVVETDLNEASSPRVVDATVSTTTDAC